LSLDDLTYQRGPIPWRGEKKRKGKKPELGRSRCTGKITTKFAAGGGKRNYEGPGVSPRSKNELGGRSNSEGSNTKQQKGKGLSMTVKAK